MLNIPKDTVEEFWSWDDVEWCLANIDKGAPDLFRQSLAEYLRINPDQLLLTPSGRLGLEWFLSTLFKNKKGHVLASAFNCPVIGDAIINAGLDLVSFDFSEPSGKINWDDLFDIISLKPLAIIIPHLFGAPVDFYPILEKCKDLNIIVIEDCAHTLGGTIRDKTAGTIGDAAIFSFNYDKPLSLGWGGALLINDENLKSLLPSYNCEIPNVDLEFNRLKVFSDFLKHRRINIPKKQMYSTKILQILKFKRKHFFETPKVGIGPLRAQLGIWQLNRYKDILKIRNSNANLIIKKANNFSTWWVDGNVNPAWLKQRILTNPKERGLRVAVELQKKGLRVGNFNWPSLIGEKHSLHTSTNALTTATYGIDVPVHQNILKEELNTIVASLSNNYERINKQN